MNFNHRGRVRNYVEEIKLKLMPRLVSGTELGAALLFGGYVAK